MFKIKVSRIFIIVLTCIFIFKLDAYAIDPQQTAGGLEKLQQDQDMSKKLEQRVGQKKEKPEIQEKDQAAPAVAEGEKVLVKKINVEGVAVLSAAEISKITTPYENKKLSITEMQKVADLITDLYRTKDYPTSRAYIPPQTIGKDGVMVIRIVEGRVGEISVKGNKFFKDRLYKKKIETQD
jgi:hemolysin activation/secretion protein